MTKAYPFEEISNWLTPPTDIQPHLDTDITADVVIIGGGFAGLSTALSLKDRDIDAVIVEKGFCGSGSSGRNAGHLSPTIGKDIPSILKMFGKEKAKHLLRFSEGAISYTTDLIERLGIDCDYVPRGNIIASVHASQNESLQKTAEAAASIGADVEYLDENHMRQNGLPRAFLSGIWEKHGGILQPGKYVLGLRQAALRAGVRIYENSPMLRVEEGSRPVIHCDHGSVTANHLVQATNAYTNGSRRMKRWVAPLRVTQFETEPLSEEQRSRIGWQGREGIYTAHEMLENFRLTEHGTLIGGSKIVRNKFGGGLPEGYHEPTFAKLTTMFRDRFPELSDVKIAKWWGGWIGMTTNFLPRIGAHKKHPNIHHAIGFNGHGVPQTTLAGSILADTIAGEGHEFADLFAKPGFAWPPEPLTWIGGNILTGVMGAMDARIDRKVRALH